MCHEITHTILWFTVHNTFRKLLKIIKHLKNNIFNLKNLNILLYLSFFNWAS